MKHNTVKNPNWWEANQLAIYKRGRGLELGSFGSRVQCSNHLATLLLLFHVCLL